MLERGFLLALQGAAELAGVDAEMIDALGDDDEHVAEVAAGLLRWTQGRDDAQETDCG